MNQMLKKITALLLAMTMLLGMAACGKTAQPAHPHSLSGGAEYGM